MEKPVPISIPIKSADVFEKLQQVVIRITNTAKTVDDQLVLGKSADLSKKKELVLAPESVETTAKVSKAKYVDNSSDKQLKIDLTFLVADYYQLTVVLMGPQPQIYESTMVHVSEAVAARTQPVIVVGTTGTPASAGDGIVPPTRVSLVEPNRFPTPEDQDFWRYIRNGTLNFNLYKRFVDEVMFPEEVQDTRKIFPEPVPGNVRRSLNRSPILRTDAYSFLKQATDFFMSTLR